MQYSICRNKKKRCPCRTFDLEVGCFRCIYPKIWSQLTIAKEERKLKDLLNKICDSVRNEELHTEQIVIETKKDTVKFLKNVKIGDTVFCQTELDNVKLLEMPLPTDYYGYCKYQRKDGVIRKSRAPNFIKISTGNYYAEFVINFAEKTRVKDFEYLTRSSGFRVEVIDQKNSYLLKIFGDSQQEVDDFVTYVCQSDFMVY